MRHQLLVEGRDDLVSVVNLMKARIGWPERVEEAPFFIRDCKGVEKLLDKNFISAVIKERDLSAVGFMLDADLNSAARWQSLRHYCSSYFPDLPEVIPDEGLITTNAAGLKIGVWLMPNNVSSGSLETFLAYLLPEDSEPLWSHAVSSVSKAREIGMPCHPEHEEKACLYTWLAWQDPPGQLCGRALAKKILDPSSNAADMFVNWLKTLFLLEGYTTTNSGEL